jgi:hypothetical protein
MWHNVAVMGDKEELAKLQERKRNYESIVNDSRRKKFDRDMAQGDLDGVNMKIADLKKKIEAESEKDGGVKF